MLLDVAERLSLTLRWHNSTPSLAHPLAEQGSDFLPDAQLTSAGEEKI
jgi:hypothetical protein